MKNAAQQTRIKDDNTSDVVNTFTESFSHHS